MIAQRMLLVIDVKFCRVVMIFLVTTAGHVTAKLANVVKKMGSQNIMA